jgi:uncharacterized CHY-type Zn-finger protein
MRRVAMRVGFAVVVVGLVSMALIAADGGTVPVIDDAHSEGVADVDAEPALEQNAGAKSADAKSRDEKPNKWRSRAVPVVEGDAPAPLESPEDLLARLPTFAVQPRTPVLKENGMYPCSECHEGLDPDFTVRELVEEHDTLKLFHGGGRFWCHTCHDPVNRDVLVSLDKKPISFDQSFLLCGQCHFEAQRDFVHGAHGKRIGNWQGERVIAPCTSCHDAHSPSIKPRAPADIPRTRREIHGRTPAVLSTKEHANGAHD